jgi:hypothetical protein
VAPRTSTDPEAALPEGLSWGRPWVDSLPVLGAATSQSGPDEDVQQFWLYKRGQLVLVFNSAAGPFIPTRGVPDEDPQNLMKLWEWGSGQFMSTEWEPRVRHIMRRAEDLVDFIERLEDRRYEVDLEPPSKRVRHFRFL